MLGRIFFACLLLLLGLCGSGSSLSCRWMDHKFRQYSEQSLDLIEMMGNNSTNSTEDEEEENRAAFPLHLYSQASKASAEDKVAFAAQVLKEVCVLFDEDYSSSSWEESTVDDFVNMVNRQADELHSCIGKHGQKKKNTKLHMHFKRLSSHILKKMGHSSEAWELIRQQVTAHLMETDLLVASLLTAN